MRVRSIKSFSNSDGTYSEGEIYVVSYDIGAPLVDAGLVERVERFDAADPLALALNEIQSTYGVTATIEGKAKSINKWGYNSSSAGSSTWETVQSGGGTETLLAANLITVIDSTSASDTGTVVIEGHYLDASGNLVFHVQSVTLTGTTAVVLSQALSRCSRMYISTADVAVGTITVNAGEAGTVYNRIVAGDAQTEKCATSFSYRDFFIVTNFGSWIFANGTPRVVFRLEVSTDGGAWRPQARWSLRGDGSDYDRVTTAPPFIIPPNSDIRIRSSANSSGVEVGAHFSGYLAINEDYINDASPSPA